NMKRRAKGIAAIATATFSARRARPRVCVNDRARPAVHSREAGDLVDLSSNDVAVIAATSSRSGRLRVWQGLCAGGGSKGNSANGCGKTSSLRALSRWCRCYVAARQRLWKIRDKRSEETQSRSAGGTSSSKKNLVPPFGWVSTSNSEPMATRSRWQIAKPRPALEK